MEFADVEENRKLTLDARSMKPDYLRSLEAFRGRYKADSARAGIDYVPMDTSIGFDAVACMAIYTGRLKI